jgi:hypothetical protein
MEALAQKQVASVIRIIPDPGKDVRLQILSQFRYSDELPILTVDTLVEALDRLSDQNVEPGRHQTRDKMGEQAVPRITRK